MRLLQILLLFTGILAFNTGYAQTKKISGLVLDADNRGLQGVTVQVKGSSNATTTDMEGRFVTNVPSRAESLEFSFIGMESQQIKIGSSSNLKVQLRKSNTSLTDVVVTGYSAQSRRSITGSVVNVKGEELKDLPVTNVNEALQGRVSGVTVTTGGDVSAPVSVRIRGIGTLNGSDPLYIIDGVPTTGNLNLINPADIESISVLKDASAASIYGSRAANGVIIIETKMGKTGQKPTVTVDAYVGASSIPANKILKMLNTPQWADALWSSRVAGGVTPSHPQLGNGATPVIPDFINPVGAKIGDPNTTIDTYDINTNQIIPANKVGTKWVNGVLHTGLVQNYNVGITGGGVGSRYSLGFGALNREGTVIDTRFERYNIRANSEFSLFNNHIRVGENLNFSYSQNHGSGGSNAIGLAIYMNPMIPIYDIAGNYAGTRGGALALGTNQDNPIATQVRHKDDINRMIDVLGSVHAEADILKSLTFRTNLGVQLGTNHSTYFAPFSPEETGNQTTNDLTEGTGWSSSLTWTNTLKYTSQFAGIHRVSVLAGTEAVETRSNGYSATRRTLFSADPAFRYLIASGGTQSNGASLPTFNNLFSQFAKLDYSILNRYILSATIRRDGSSKFGGNNKYGVFPALGAAWVISDESFLKANPVINTLKLRVGWGKTGNQASTGDFAFADLYGSNPQTAGYDINATSNSVVQGFAISSRGNPNLKWETTTTSDIGTDVSILRDKVYFTFDWYDRETTNMLAAGTLPGAAGAVAPPIINVGQVSNKGIDVSLGYKNNFGDWRVDLAGTVFSYKNKIISIDGNPNTFLLGGPGGQSNFATRNQAGHPISAFYGLMENGVIQSGTTAGNFNFLDLHKDTIINGDDQIFIGDPNPKFQYSLNTIVSYKNLDLVIFIRGIQGGQLWNWNKYFTDFDNRSNFNRGIAVLHAWTPANKNNSLAQYNFATAGYNSQPSNYFVEDGSYLRIQNVQLNYNFSKIRNIKTLRVYVQAQNLFTITKYTGMDPEVIGNNYGFGVDTFNYPPPRSFLVGVNFGF